MGTDRIKVVVANSSEIYALGLCCLLAEDERVEVFNHAHSVQDVVEITEQVKPDIILIDLKLLNHNGDRILKFTQGLYPGVKIMVLSPPEDIDSLPDNMINVGVTGILPDDITPTELHKAIFDMFKFGGTIHSTMIPQILEKLATKQEERPEAVIQLSRRESKVMELVAEGMCNHEIAEALLISRNTVKGHLRKITSKVKARNRVDLARYALLNKQTEQKDNLDRNDL